MSYTESGPVADLIERLQRLPTIGRKTASRLAFYLLKAPPAEARELADAIRSRMPGFTMEYEVDPLRQAIADSWPDSLDDSAAREEWGWRPRYDLGAMVDEMLQKLGGKLAAGP